MSTGPALVLISSDDVATEAAVEEDSQNEDISNASLASTSKSVVVSSVVSDELEFTQSEDADKAGRWSQPRGPSNSNEKKSHASGKRRLAVIVEKLSDSEMTQLKSVGLETTVQSPARKAAAAPPRKSAATHHPSTLCRRSRGCDAFTDCRQSDASAKTEKTAETHLRGGRSDQPDAAGPRLQLLSRVRL